MMPRRADALAWTGVGIFILWTLRPVLADWSGSVLGPFGSIDAMFQLGLLRWSAAHWWQPAVWVDLPIFYPLHGMLGCMDTLLGQAWLVWPLQVLFHPTAAAFYNTAFAGSLLLAAGGMAALWRAGAGTWRGAGVAALALVGAPYTTAQLGHLNQLPPPFVLLTLAAVLMALRRRDSGGSAGPWWWLTGAALVMQASWGWYGFAYAVVGTAVLKITWLARRARAGSRPTTDVAATLKQAWLPALVTVLAVYGLAQPQLQLQRRYPGFTRDVSEVRLGSADIQHLANRGAYRVRPADLLGKGPRGEDRYRDWARPTLHPGWIALGLALYGWWKRREPGSRATVSGVALLVAGVVGLVLAFGDSVGVPGTAWRLSLPLEWLRTVAPPFRAFRGAWRFAWLMSIAVAWWAAAGTLALTEARSRRRQHLAVPLVLVLALTSLPEGVPALSVPMTGRPLPVARQAAGPVLTLPAPINEYAEDSTEALWLTRAQELGQPVTGGATGWVPPETASLRTQINRCTGNDSLAVHLLRKLEGMGVVEAEVAVTPGSKEARFWRRILPAVGATRIWGGDIPGYERYRLRSDASHRP